MTPTNFLGRAAGRCAPLALTPHAPWCKTARRENRRKCLYFLCAPCRTARPTRVRGVVPKTQAELGFSLSYNNRRFKP
jgi:hypothetical protein